MNREQLLGEALRLPINSIEYYVSQQLAALYPEKALISGGDTLFNVEEYALVQQCTLEVEKTVFSDIVTAWHGQRKGMMDPAANALKMCGIVPVTTWSKKGLLERARNAWFKVTWQEQVLDVIIMNWGDILSKEYHYWILAERKEIAEGFLVAVCEYNVEVRGEILVFTGGCWRKDEELFRDIQDATFDNLVLRGTLKSDIHDDFAQFFRSRQLYETHRVPWKRGILFIGPPGNGKTHAVKAIINAISEPCLYVKSFKADFGPDEENIRRVFNRARKSAPCILVLEDLDTLITPQNRSFFLNELDGFAANAGVVTLATTNHPERLDAAILERPSRFDRKYPFDLPSQTERLAYIALWNGSLESELRLSEAAQARISELSGGFSFAYLKELFLSSMMRWIATSQVGMMEQVMIEQISVLREQMISTSTAVVETPGEEENNPFSAFARIMSQQITS